MRTFILIINLLVLKIIMITLNASPLFSKISTGTLRMHSTKSEVFAIFSPHPTSLPCIIDISLTISLSIGCAHNASAVPLSLIALWKRSVNKIFKCEDARIIGKFY